MGVFNCPACFQRNVESDLKSVVSFLRERFGVDYFYCWHGLSGYWGGVSLEVTNALSILFGPAVVLPSSGLMAPPSACVLQAAGVANLPVDIVFANPTPGVMEVEPAMNWGPASLAGVGIVRDPVQLYQVSVRPTAPGRAGRGQLAE